MTFWRWLWGLFRPYQAGIAALCLCAAGQSMLQVALAVLTRYVIDAGIAGDSRFPFLGAALLAVLLGMVALRGVVSWAAGSISDRSGAALRHELLEAAERSGGESLRQFHSGTLLNRGTEDVRLLCAAMTDLLPTVAGNLVRLAGAFTLLAVFAPSLAAILAAVCALVGIGAVCLRPMLRRNHRAVRSTEERAFSTMQEYVQQLELLQALGAEEESLRRFQDKLDDSLRAKRTRRLWTVSGGTALSLLTQLGTGCLLLWGVRAIYAGALTYGALTAILQLLALFRGPVVSLSGLWGRLAAVEVSAGRLQELFGEQNAEQIPADIPRLAKVTAVVFEDVTFRYKAEEPPVLEHYNARFDLTGWSCLTGGSGRGKSTLFKLILGLYQPQRGRVYLETDCGEVPCGRDTRHLFAYVPQDFTLFSGSIRENLLLAAPGADEQKCMWALETAQADFALGTGAGLDTQVKEQRAGLSMGQLQRVAIARAVLMERPILLLDECTSALDSATEGAVLRSLKNLGQGAILVTHHPDVLAGMNDVRRVDMEGSL